VPRPTQDTSLTSLITHTGLSPCIVCLSRQLPILIDVIIEVLQPQTRLDVSGLGLSRFARRYSGNLFDFFSSPYLDVSVQVVGLHYGYRSCNLWVVPFGYLGVNRLCAPNPSFSQLVASFFASRSHRHSPCALLCFSLILFILLLLNNILLSCFLPVCQ
jgi:hypothetical protein